MVNSTNVVDFAPFLEARKREFEKLPLLAVAEGQDPPDAGRVLNVGADGAVYGARRPLSEREVAHRARMLQHLRRR